MIATCSESISDYIDLDGFSVIESSDTGVLIDIAAAPYHRDPCRVPSLSYSIAKVLIKESPYHAWLNHPRLGNVRKEPTAAMERGDIIHGLVLGQTSNVTLPENVRVIEVEDYKTKAAQAQRDAAIAEGCIPWKRKEADEWLAGTMDTVAVASAVRTELGRRGISLTGISESAIIWLEESSEGPVVCRGMLDHLFPPPLGVIFDLKTCQSAHPRDVAYHVEKFRYDIQAAAYSSALKSLFPDAMPMFMWAFVEELPKGSPKRIELTTAHPSDSMKARGADDWRRAVETWARCLKANYWNGYVNEEIEVSPPKWAHSMEALL